VKRLLAAWFPSPFSRAKKKGAKYAHRMQKKEEKKKKKRSKKNRRAVLMMNFTHSACMTLVEEDNDGGFPT
jgi:hypothetical protein